MGRWGRTGFVFALAAVVGCGRRPTSTPPAATASVDGSIRTAGDGGRGRARPQPPMPRADAGADDETVRPRSSCVSPRAVDNVVATIAMLDHLEELMEGFGPPPDPFVYGRVPPQCMTSLAAALDPARAGAEAARIQAAEQAERTARAAHAARVRDWTENEREIAWIWDAHWQTRTRQTPTGPEPLWRVRGQPVQPELTRRALADTSVHPEADLYCLVREAVLSSDRTSIIVMCEVDERHSPYNLQFSLDLAAAPGSPIPTLGRGDLLKIHGGDRFIARNFSRRDGDSWGILLLPSTELTVEERSTCCPPPPPPAPPALAAPAAPEAPASPAPEQGHGRHHHRR